MIQMRTLILFFFITEKLNGYKYLINTLKDLDLLQSRFHEQ